MIFATSAVLGFVREIVLAAYFGASAQMDALLVALIIPTFFLNMLGEASMGAAVVPVFIKYVAPQKTSEQRRIVGSAFTLLSLVLSGVAAFGVIFAPAIARVFAPGFDQTQLGLTTQLMRLLIPSVLFLGLSNFVTGLLHSFRKFGPAAATGVVFNLAVVLATIPLASRFGIFAPAIGVFAGAVLQLGIMLPSLIGTGLFPSAGLSFRDPALFRMWQLFWPIFVGGLMVTALKTVDKIVGSFLPEGSISALNYASKIGGGPSRIFAMSIAVVLFPAFVRKVAEDAKDRGEMIATGLNLAAFLTLPWTALLIALREPVVFVVLQRGAFDASATPRVALALAVYCLGDFADGISTMVNNAYYSHHDSKLPTYIYVGSNIFRAVAVVALVPLFGYLAIAAGNVLAVDIAIVVLLVMLRRHIPDFDLKSLGIGFLKIVVAAAGAGVVGWAVFSPFAAAVAGSQLWTVAALAASALPALAAYFVLARAMGSQEAALVQRRLLGFVRRA